MEISSNDGKEMPFSEVPRGILDNWQMATWLMSGDSVIARLSSSGRIGITYQELKQAELLSSRITTINEDPPIYLFYQRHLDTSLATFKMQRYSETLKEWEDILSATGDIQRSTLSIITRTDRDKVVQVTKPILDKVAMNKEILAESVCERSKSPNKMLMRSYFATIPSNAYWLQLDSPQSQKIRETSTDPVYRIYVNPHIDSVQKYGRIINYIGKTARNYKERGLNFKMMYGGEGARTVVLDPDATKIVFYFINKNDAMVFGSYLDSNLSENEEMHSTPPENNYEYNYLPQEVWRDGLILMGKGTREKRKSIVERVKNPDTNYQERQRLMRKAELFSITTDNNL